MQNALVLYPFDSDSRQRLLSAAGADWQISFREDTWSREQLVSALEIAEIILGEPKNEDLLHCKKLRWMQSTSSGVNYYVEGGAFPRDAMLSSMTGFYGPILAEHMLAILLSLCRRLPDYRDQQHAHKWEIRKFDKQLEGATVMILGAGDIGTTLARWMRPMVGRIIGVRRVVREYPDCYDQMLTLEELDAHIGEADILLCALPHTPQTRHLLNEDRLRKMKADAVLVNGGRGSLIDQEALLRVMAEGHLWGVGLDVADPEPLPEDHPLWDQPRLILIPHAAGNSYAPGSPLNRKILNYLVENASRYLRGERPENLVDFATGYRETK